MASSVKAASNVHADHARVDDTTYGAGPSVNWDTSLTGLGAVDADRETTAGDMSNAGSPQSHRLDIKNFGFAIPSGATIDGVVARITWKCSLTRRIDWLQTRLIKAGSPAGNNKATGSLSSFTDVQQSRGGSTDLWGTTWTDSDINSSGFGVALQFQRVFPTGVRPQVNYVEIEVYYTESSGTNVSATTDTLIITEQAATIGLDKTVAAGFDELVITEFPASVDLGFSQNVQATTDTLVITEQAATIGLAINVQAGTDALVITEYPVSFSSSLNVQASTQALVLTENQATLSFSKNVTNNVFPLVIQPRKATIGAGETAVQRGSFSRKESDFKTRQRLRKLALQQAHLEDDDEALAILLATIMRKY